MTSTAPTSPSVLFEPDGSGCFVPTAASVGPWSPSALHGGAVGALLAGLLEDPEQILVRLTLEMLCPVPLRPLRAELSPREGGRRVGRQSAQLTVDGRPVARATAVRMRATEVELPASALGHDVEFDPSQVPILTSPDPHAASSIRWDSFNSLALATGDGPPQQGDEQRRRLWIKLLLPIVPGRPPSQVERAVAAADLAQIGIAPRLPFRSWSFISADLTVAFARPPVGEWIGLSATGIISATGTGQTVARLHDASGLLGHAGQSVLIERRP